MEQRLSLEVVSNPDHPPMLATQCTFATLINQIANYINSGMFITKITATVDMITPVGMDAMPTGQVDQDYDGTKVFIPDTSERIRSFLVDFLPKHVGTKMVCDPSDLSGWFQALVHLFTSLNPSISEEDVTVDNLNEFFRIYNLYYRICIIEECLILFKCDRNWEVTV